MNLAIIFISTYAVSTVATAKIERDHRVRHAFVKEQACPSTGKHRLPCPGYVIDHIKALACGGLDHPSNLQWQTVAEGKAKDKWERNECSIKVKQ